jgi:hypothetical protein
MSACRNAASGQKIPIWARRLREISSWILPGAILALMPKCPVCLATYLALFTGVSLSISTAGYLRWAMLLVCFASLLFLVVQCLRRIGTTLNFNYFKRRPSNVTQSRKSRGMDCRPEGTAQGREGTHTAQRRVGSAAAGAAVGSD